MNEHFACFVMMLLWLRSQYGAWVVSLRNNELGDMNTRLRSVLREVAPDFNPEWLHPELD